MVSVLNDFESLNLLQLFLSSNFLLTAWQKALFFMSNTCLHTSNAIFEKTEQLILHIVYSLSGNKISGLIIKFLHVFTLFTMLKKTLQDIKSTSHIHILKYYSDKSSPI